MCNFISTPRNIEVLYEIILVVLQKYTLEQIRKKVARNPVAAARFYVIMMDLFLKVVQSCDYDFSHVNVGQVVLFCKGIGL